MWSNWSSWSKCNKKCGTGIQRRFRSCTNPPPSQFGMSCYGYPEGSQNKQDSNLDPLNRAPGDLKYVGVEKSAYENILKPVYENRTCNLRPCGE